MVLLVLFRLVIAMPASASSDDYDLAKNLAKIKKMVYAQRHDYDWTQETWTADDQPYLLIQANIDKNITNGQNPDDLLMQCRKEALADPNNTKALFRWAYAAYRAASQVELAPSQVYLRFETPGSIYSVQTFMMKNYAPSYHYTRLLFLLLNSDNVDSRTGELGQRLLKRNPDDKEVRYDMLVFKSWDSRPQVRRQAEQEAEHLAQQGSLGGYWVLADMYLRMLNVSRTQFPNAASTQTIANKAIEALGHYVQLAPLQSGKRKLAQEQIKKVKQDQSDIVAGTYR